ncbi:MAG: FHA domain-containing protein [Zetaproteobacteria bacterium]|nr:MAG: FHA domain-containing protein [Zetaproteobacteria bacterium]
MSTSQDPDGAAGEGRAERIEFSDGEVIVAEGTKSPAVFFVVEGVVKVTTVDEQGHEVVLAWLRQGEIFGEMSLMCDVPASASVVADGAVTVHRMTLEGFMDAVRSPLARMVMESLFARLRRMNHRLLELESQLREEERRVDRLRLRAESDAMRAQVGDAPVEVERFPFHIGRGRDDGKLSFFSLWHNDLVIEEHAPYHVSRKHCLIDRRGDDYYLVDRHSHYGTLVDGVQIGGGAADEELHLTPGRHRVQLGRADSPFVLWIEVPAGGGA